MVGRHCKGALMERMEVGTGDLTESKDVVCCKSEN